MNCRERQHDIILSLYDELGDPHQAELRVHMEGCPECQEFWESEKRLHSELTEDFSAWEVPADLLVESRRALSEGLDRIEERRWRWPAIVPPFLRIRLLESAALVSIGLAVGVYLMNQRPLAQEGSAGEVELAATPTSISAETAVSNLRITEADPITGQVQLAGELVQPIELEGNLQDPNVRNLLFGALRSRGNPGARLRAVELLAQDARDANVKEALIGALLGDENIGVRLQALEGLQSFSKQADVRQALIYALENDANPGVRVKAIEALTPLTADEAMEGIVTENSRKDPNAYVTMRALQFVGTGNSGN
jgi:hypothetical protein